MEYGSPEVRNVGQRVEISPCFDLWMRGARFGTVHSIKGDIIKVRMDHWQVRKLLTCKAEDLKPVR